MNAEITFSGPLALIKLLCQYAEELDDEWNGTEREGIEVPKLNIQLGTEQKLQNYAAGGVPATGEPVKKPTETKAQKAARLKAEKEAAAAAQPAVDPNVAANQAIQQQHEWAQQNTQPLYPQQPAGFPSAPVAPAQPAVFPASQPAQPVVDTAAQAWLAPHAVNAPAGPTLEQLYQLLNQITSDNAKRGLFMQYLQHKGIQDITVIKDQPEAINEAYGIVQKIISGEIHA